MGEDKKEVKTHKVSYLCEKCGDGEMLPTGICLTSNPPQYPHRCNKCGENQTFSGSPYPRIEYNFVGVET